MSRVLVIGDVHAPAMRPEYPDFLRKIQKDWKTDRVVFIGDIIDWSAISYHEKNPHSPGFMEERDKAQCQVNILYKMFPKADWLIGNHDCLPARKAATAGLGEGLLKDYRDYWGVPGWKTHERYEKLDIDGTLYMHGDRGKGGAQAALKNARDLFRNVVQGHFHSEMGVWWHCNEDARVFGLNVGTGVDDSHPAMLYNKPNNRRSCLGCAVVIDGDSPFVEPMLLRGKHAKHKR